MNFEELKSRDISELRTLAAKMSIKTHHKHTAEKIAKMIVEEATKPKQDNMKHPAVAEKKEAALNTEDQVNQVIEPFLKKEGFIAQFPGDDTWIFKCRGAEESGHMSVPLRVIRMKAESVSRGARKPTMVDLGDGKILGVG